MKKKEFKALLPVIIVAGTAIISLLMILFLQGATKTVTEVGVLTTKTTISVVSFKGLIFGGGPKVVTVNNGNPTSLTYEGGMSTFGIISLILLVLGVLTVASSIFFTDKKQEKTSSIIFLVGSSLIALAGLCMLLVLAGGSALITAKTVIGNQTFQTTSTFAKYFEGFTLASGPIVYALLAILGGGFGVANHFLKIVK